MVTARKYFSLTLILLGMSSVAHATVSRLVEGSTVTLAQTWNPWVGNLQYVTIPSLGVSTGTDVSCRVYNSTNQVVNGSALITVQFNSEIYDTSNMHDVSISSRSKIVATVAGKYHISGGVNISTYQTFANIQQADMFLKVNGSTTVCRTATEGLTNIGGTANPNTDETINCSSDWYLDIGDYVEMQFKNNDGSAVTLLPKKPYAPYMSMTLYGGNSTGTAVQLFPSSPPQTSNVNITSATISGPFRVFDPASTYPLEFLYGTPLSVFNNGYSLFQRSAGGLTFPDQLRLLVSTRAYADAGANLAYLTGMVLSPPGGSNNGIISFYGDGSLVLNYSVGTWEFVKNVLFDTDIKLAAGKALNWGNGAYTMTNNTSSNSLDFSSSINVTGAIQTIAGGIISATNVEAIGNIVADQSLIVTLTEIYYNNAFTAGNGRSVIRYSTDTANNGSAVGPFIMYNAPANGVYHVDGYISVSTAASSGSISLVVTFTDEVGSSRNQSISVSAGPGTGSAVLAATFYAKIGTNISYSTTFNTVVGTPGYSDHIRLFEE